MYKRIEQQGNFTTMKNAMSQYNNSLTRKLLSKLGNNQPTFKQIVLVDNLLNQVTINHPLAFDSSLTKREISCLLLAAKGQTAKETAQLLDIKLSTVETYRKSIKRKLQCTSMAQAIFVGIKLGYLKALSE